MRGALLIAAALSSGCLGADRPEVPYTCLLIRSCGDRGWAGRVPFPPDPQETREAVDGWLAACAALTFHEFDAGKCASVSCVALCEVCLPDDPETLVCKHAR